VEFSRRGFLGTLLGGAAAAVAAQTFDPERLLWVPGAKTIFLPSQKIAVAETMDQAIADGLEVEFPDGMRWMVRGEKGINEYYGGYENLVRNVKAQGGRILREWTTHSVES